MTDQLRDHPTRRIVKTSSKASSKHAGYQHRGRYSSKFEQHVSESFQEPQIKEEPLDNEDRPLRTFISQSRPEVKVEPMDDVTISDVSISDSSMRIPYFPVILNRIIHSHMQNGAISNPSRPAGSKTHQPMETITKEIEGRAATRDEGETEKKELESRIEELEAEKRELQRQNGELEARKIELEHSLREHRSKIHLQKNKLSQKAKEHEATATRNKELEAELEGKKVCNRWPSHFRQVVYDRWSSRHCGYSEVKALLVQWASDDLGVAKEIESLKDVLATLYNFEVSTFLIPDRHPSSALTERVNKFIDKHSPKTLLIFCYSGHGMINARNDYIWAAKKSGGPNMPSHSIQTLFEETSSDVLLLHDACHAADTSMIEKYPPSQSVTELIAACGFDGTAPGVGSDSFAHALIEELRMASDT